MAREASLACGPDRYVHGVERQRSRRRPAWVGLAILAVALVFALSDAPSGGPRCAALRSQPAAEPAGAASAGAIERLFLARVSGRMVEGEGRVRAVLPDDRQGSRHQRFILELAGGHTLLVSHNVDLAPRIDGLARGDRVAFRGQYEWNERGGVLHWTHRDPDGRRPGGWLRHAGRTHRQAPAHSSARKQAPS